MTDPLVPALQAARARLADDLAGLTDDQWHRPTLCTEWDVEQVVAHLTAAATTSMGGWLRSMALAGLRPAVHNRRRLREQLGTSPAETLQRFRTAVSSTVAPTKDTAAWLGEVLVHGEDIRRPLGLESDPDVDVWSAVAEFYASRDFTVPSRTTAKSLHLEATDGPFRHGSGPVVTGPTSALVMVMAGRAAHLADLEGDGVAVLADRLTTRR
jgi:uncharacterized protein (TIGR03083 family)